MKTQGDMNSYLTLKREGGLAALQPK